MRNLCVPPPPQLLPHASLCKQNALQELLLPVKQWLGMEDRDLVSLPEISSVKGLQMFLGWHRQLKINFASYISDENQIRFKLLSEKFFW